jgi:hypothetical protein
MIRTRALLLPVLAGVFFLVTAWFGRPVGGLWNSPDETANAYWAEQVATAGPLAVHDIVVGLGAGAIHPRSMGVAGDALVPGSFPGLFLIFGTLKLMMRLPFHAITPIFSALAGLLFGALVSRLFDRRVGFWAAVLFFTHPAFLYYGARGLFHNELCLDLLIISAALFALRPFKAWLGRGEILDDLLGGFVFAFAIVTRASEAIWAVPAFLAFLPLIKKDRWRRVFYVLIGAALPTFIFLMVNASLYGSSFRTGYAIPPVEQTVTESSIGSVPSRPATMSLPFGFHPRSIATHLWSYGLALFWWQTLLAGSGFVWWLLHWRKAGHAQKTTVAAALITSAWLAIFYGSWQVMDRLDPMTVTIGTSYVRYFLPVYLAAIPFAALALTRAEKALGASWFAPIIVAFGALLSLRIAIYAGDESLKAVRLTLESNAMKKWALLAAIPPEAVVMTERFDKLLVPDRLRIIPATDDAAFHAAAVAVTYGLPTYWYGLAPTKAETDRLSTGAAKEGLVFGTPSSPVAGEALYPLLRQ